MFQRRNEVIDQCRVLQLASGAKVQAADILETAVESARILILYYAPIFLEVEFLGCDLLSSAVETTGSDRARGW